ncbi:EscU/YscU/HrcU family type III secretion system export apparatus switch protein [Ramlibacter sp.]|uniref:EscU/YscU/HrcU family type III secretion system export apparatus switch protein n=1 Tax=Ramlibacter sp. TaxID=1917967 RepID=UPI003D104AF8
MTQQQDADRSHEATPYKLQKARERGQVARSRDIVSAAVITVAMAFLAWQGWPAWREQFAFDHALLVSAGHMRADMQGLWALVERGIAASLALGAPFLACVVVAAVAGNLVQTGPVVSAHPLKPDFTRLDPGAGLKRLLSTQSLFNGLRTVLKVTLLSAAIAFVLGDMPSRFAHLASLGAAGLLRTLLDDFASLGLKLALVLWIIAAVDFAFTRRQFAQQMRMSRKELTDELKHREGDPRVRARLRELRRELRKRSAALRNTSKSDVVITNPTHLAVALRYEHGAMAAPEVVAKGAGLLAAAMRHIAARHGIPVVQNPPLARRLYRELRIEQALPPQYFAEVARIVVWLLAMKRAREAGAAA